MRRMLLALAMIAASAFMAAPAMADETDPSESVTANDSTPEPSPSPSDEQPSPGQEPSPKTETSEVGDQNAESGDQKSGGGDQSSGGGDQSSGGGDQTSSSGAPSQGAGQAPGNELTPEMNEVLEAGQTVLEALVTVFAKPQAINVSICHFPPGNPENVQFITIGNPAVLAAHLKNHDGDFVATSESDCPVIDPEDPEDDPKVHICHFPPGNPENVQFLEIGLSALADHILNHGDFVADEESDCTEGPGEEDKVTICHFPPGNPENVQFLEIGVSALQAHLVNHGDFLADSESDCFDNGDGDGDGDDDDGDDDGDDGDHGDGDDDKAAVLPDTGGPSQWNLIVGVLLTLLGFAILSNRESLVRAGLFQLVPVDAPSEPGSTSVGRHAADLPATVVEPRSHRGTWTVLGATALVAVAILGRRATK